MHKLVSKALFYVICLFCCAQECTVFAAAGNNAGSVQMNCSTGVELAAAFANSRVTSVQLLKDIKLHDEDWSRYGLPVLLDRNLTIEGPASIDAAFVKGKVQLGNAITLLFRNIVLLNYRSGAANQAPGFDLLTNMRPNESGLLKFQDGALLFRACFDVKMITAETISERAASIAGNQTYMLPFPLPQSPDCVNSSTAPFLERCYAYVIGFADVAFPGQSVSAITSRLEPTGYVLHILNTRALCMTVMLPDCIAKLQPLGCTLYTLTQLPTLTLPEEANVGPPSAPPAQLAQPNTPASGSPPGIAPPEGGDSGSGAARAIVLGSVLGGVGLLGIVAVCTFVVVKRSHGTEKRLGDVNGDVLSSYNSSFFCISRRSSMAAERSYIHCGYAAAAGVELREENAVTKCELRVELATQIERRGRAQGAERGPRELVANDSGANVRDTRGSPSAGSSNGTATRDVAQQKEFESEVAVEDGCAQPRIPAEFDVVTPLTPLRLGLRLNIPLRPTAEMTKCETASMHTTPHVIYSSQETTLTATGDTYATSQTITNMVKSFRNFHRARGGAGRPGTHVHAPAESETCTSSSITGGDSTNNSDVVTLLPLVLGKGAFGRVHEGMYRGRKVAVKVMSELAFGNSGMETQRPAEEALATAALDCEQGQQQQQQQQQQQWHQNALSCCTKTDRQFIQEVEVLGRCQHPNVVQLLAACVTPPRFCLVMELMEMSLERLIFGGRAADNEPQLLPLSKVLYIGIKICEGLAYLHPTIIHRDLKPANVLINRAHSDEPEVKLSDFGLSRLHNTTGFKTMTPEAGTAAYLSPECCDMNNSTVSYRTDIYAFGVVLWVMLTGQHPWMGYAPLMIAIQVAFHERRLPLNQLGPSRCPSKLAELISQCWETDPRRRPAAAEIAKKLTKIQLQVSEGPT